MDGRKILLDCGWDDRMDVQALDPLRRIAPWVDAVLISHPDTAHLGALPYAFGTLGMACKVYATLPVHKMGMMFMYDQFLARAAEGDFDLFSLDDVDRAFGAFVPVRYAQHSALEFPTRAAETANDASSGAEEGREGGSDDGSGGKEKSESKKSRDDSGAKYAPSGITVTAYAAGHTLGGAVWKVHKDAEDVVYAVDYNHRREKHLNGTTLDSINRPSLLITDAFNARGEPAPKTRDDDLMRAVLRAVRSDGNVLVPVDPAGRVLELLLLLEERWAKQQLGAYQLVLLTTVAYNTMEFARSHLEWMGENVGRNFDRDRLNAFNTRYLKLCHSLEELRNLRPGPKVVLASFGSLEAGPARALFAEWAEDPKNLVVLADRGAPGSLSRRVRALSEQPPGARKPLEVRVSRRVLLDGAELEAWRLKRKDERLSKRAREAAAAEKESLPEEAEKEKEKTPSPPEAMEVDDEKKAGAVQEPAAAAAAESLLGVAQISGAGTRAAELRRRRCLIDGFEVSAAAAAPMFPDEVWDPVVDDFGEAVDADAFARAVALSARAAGASDAAIAQAEGAAKAAADAAGAARAAAQPKAIPPPAPPPMPEEVPSKIESHTKHVQLRAAVHCCDYEGRADGRSVKTLAARVEPRRVVLVHGTEEDTAFLRDALRASMPGVEVDAPGAGEAVDCTSDTAAYKLELSQELLQRTRLRDCAGYQVGWVEGVVGFAENAAGETAPVLMAPPKEAAEVGGEPEPQGGGGAVAAAETPSPDTPTRGEDVSSTAAAVAVAAATAASKERRRSAFVGDLKLTDFKIALASAGVAAEFRGGALVCAGGAVCVRKSSESENLEVEGALCDAFYRVRDILYASYQI